MEEEIVDEVVEAKIQDFKMSLKEVVGDES